jgi:hypothetical protein
VNGPTAFEAWAEAHADYFDSLTAGEVAAVIADWRYAASVATGRNDIEFAAAFQRHYTKFGTGLPPNFVLLVGADEIAAHGFDPSNMSHPRGTHESQFKKLVTTWPRASVRVGDTETGPLAYGMTFHIDGRKPIPCRAPKLTNNPAAAYAVSMLGGELPVKD